MADSNSIIHIANSALYRIGEQPITALDEGTEQANVCNELYPESRDTMLTWQTWTFATVRLPLARLAATPASDYDFYYALPSQPYCLRVIDINLDHYGYPYQRETYVDPADPTDQRAVIATNAGDVVMRYVGRVSEGQWPGIFTQATILYLAQAICSTITGKASLKQSLLIELFGPNGQGGLMLKMRDIVGHEDSPREMPMPTAYLDVRGGGYDQPRTRYP